VSIVRSLFRLLRDGARAWWGGEPLVAAGALAFFTMLSLAPLLTVALAIAGALFGEDAAAARVTAIVERAVSPGAAATVGAALESAGRSDATGLAALLGFATLLLGATAVFGQLQAALNKVWDVRPDPQRGAIRGVLTQRLLSFGLVVAAGVVLGLALLASAVLNALQELAPDAVAWPGLWQAVHVAVSLALTALLFGAVYKVLPDAEIAWSDAIVGAAVTAVLFALGQIAISIYLGRASVGSAYGAAGSLVALLVWIYYSALVFLYGAELTQVWATQHGSGIRPARHAIRAGHDRAPRLRDEPAGV
jgi:membrane protein